MKRMLSMSVLAVTMTACSTYRANEDRPAPGPLGAAPPAAADQRLKQPTDDDQATAPSVASSVADTLSAGPLTLRQALAWTALHHPSLASSAYAQRAAEAEVFQAGRLPNPEMEVDLEEISPDEGFDAAVYTLRLGQVLELGGKRRARREVAASAARLSGRDTDVAKVAVYTQTTLAFIDLLEAQARAALAQETLDLAEGLVAAAQARLDHGATTELELLRAQAHRAAATLAASTSQRDVARRRSQLAALWGGEEATFEQAVGDYEEIGHPVALEDVVAVIDDTPAVARWADEMAERLAVLHLERSARVPDLALAAGVEHASGDDETSYLVGFAIELPVFDRNSDAIRAARFRAMQAEKDRDQARLDTRSAVIGLWNEWMAARERAAILAEEALPSLLAAKTAAEAAFANGKIGYLDVLDAQEGYLDGKGDLAAARAEVHRSQAALEGILARPLSDLVPTALAAEEQPGTGPAHSPYQKLTIIPE